jgi:hypothetical protein
MKIRKIQILGLALCAVFAFGAVVAASAFAASPEWLLEGKPIVTADLVETTGALTLDVLVVGILAVALDCSGIFVGTVGPGAADLITEVLNSAKEPTSSTPLTGLALSCEVLTSALKECGNVGELAEVWLVKLPWVTELLLNGTTITDMSPAAAGYDVLCPGGKENLCEGTVVNSTLTNEASGDVLGVFSEAEEQHCVIGGAHISGNGLTVAVEGGTLTVS